MASQERARLLLHWVNSLPLASCLLVDELADLRFGDVLGDIARWVQRRRLDVWGDRLGDDGLLPNVDRQGAVERIRAVVLLAASECRSADGDAVFVLHSADCVARVMEGDCTAIGAVVGVFKRLGHQLPPCRRASPTASDKLRALRAALPKENSTKVVEHEPIKSKEKHPMLDKEASTLSAVPLRTCTATADLKRTTSAPTIESEQPKEKLSVAEKRSVPKVSTCRSRNATSGTTKHKTAVVSGAPNSHDHPLPRPRRSFHDEQGLHVFGMLDPTVKSKAPSRATTVTGECDDDIVRRTHQWLAQTLSIELPLASRCLDSSQRRSGKKQTQRNNLKRSARAQRCQLLKPFQNGILLCQIAASALHLAGQNARIQQPETGKGKNEMPSDGLHGFERNPRSRADSIRNIALARSVFRRLGVSDHVLEALDGLADPSSSLQVTAVWRVLDELRNIHASRGFSLSGTQSMRATDSSSKRSVKACERLPRVSGQCGRDEDDSHDRCADTTKTRAYISPEQCASVDAWLSSLGLAMKRDQSGVLQDALRNGVLLCSLRPCIIPLEPSRSAFYKNPRSLVEARENIARALRDISNMVPASVCEGYTGPQAVEDILLGDRQVIYGLLWHLWQHSNAREAENDQPIRQSSDAEACMTSPKVPPTPVMLDVPAVTLAEEADRLRRKVTDEDFIKRFANARQSNPRQCEITWEPHTSDEGDIFPIKTEDMCREDLESDDPVTDEPEGDTIQVEPFRKEVVPAAMHCAVDEPASPTKDRPPLRAAALHTLKRQLSQQRQTTPVQVDQQQLAAAKKQADAILLWLKGLSVRLDRPETFQDPSAALTEFQSGVLLCRIVEKVEYLRRIPGVVAPKADCATRASALHNIKKALAILQHKKTMPLHLLRRAGSIYQGDRATILCLLMEIRKAYGHHHATKTKPLVDAAEGRTACDQPAGPQLDTADSNVPDISSG